MAAMADSWQLEPMLSAAAEEGWTSTTFLNAADQVGNSVACIFHQSMGSKSLPMSSARVM